MHYYNKNSVALLSYVSIHSTNSIGSISACVFVRFHEKQHDMHVLWSKCMSCEVGNPKNILHRKKKSNITNIFQGHKCCLCDRSQGWALQSPCTSHLWTPSPNHNWKWKTQLIKSKQLNNSIYATTCIIRTYFFP